MLFALEKLLHFTSRPKAAPNLGLAPQGDMILRTSATVKYSELLHNNPPAPIHCLAVVPLCAFHDSLILNGYCE